MDPEFQRALIIVLIAGGTIAVAGAIAVALIFRAFGRKTAGNVTHLAAIAGLVSLVLLCCLVLFTISYGGR